MRANDGTRRATAFLAVGAGSYPDGLRSTLRMALPLALLCLVGRGSSPAAQEGTRAAVLLEGTWTHHGPSTVVGRRTDTAVTLKKEGAEWTITFESTLYPGVNVANATPTTTREGPYRVTVDQQELVVAKEPASVRYTFVLDPTRLILPAIVQRKPGEWVYRYEGEMFHVRCEHDPFLVPVGKAQFPDVLLGRGFYSFEEAPRSPVWPRAQYLRFLERSDEGGQMVERFRLIFDEYGSPRYERLLETGQRSTDEYQLRVFLAPGKER